MGLMDRLESGELELKDHAEEKRLDEILDRATTLMNAIEADGPPAGVVLGHELEYQRGGRNYLESGFWGLLGLMFIGIPLGMIAMFLFAFLSNPSGITPAGLICLPLLLVLVVGLIRLGQEIVSEPFQNLTDPDPVEQVVERTWLDPTNRFIAVFLHATDEATGTRHAPEISTAFFVEKYGSVSVWTYHGHAGADSVTPGYEMVVIQGDPSGESSSDVSHRIEFPYGQREEADKLGRHISDTMGIGLKLQ